MSGWVYGPGGATNPGGDNKQIQFNDGGSFGGDADLTFDKAASTLTVTGSVRITGRYHGDGSGLTGVTASAVNVADGPEFALQFRSNSPVSGELSGTANLMYSKGAVDTLHMTGNVRVGGDLNIISAGTASMSHLSGNSPIKLHASFEPMPGIPMVIGNPTIGTDCSEVATIKSRVTASCDFLFESKVSGTIGMDPGGPGTNSVQLGPEAAGRGVRDITLGFRARTNEASSTDSIAIGPYAAAGRAGGVTPSAPSGISGAGNNSIAIGVLATTSERADSQNNISLGRNASSSFGDSIAIGRDTQAWGEAGIAIGYRAAVRSGSNPDQANATIFGGTGSIAIGRFARAIANNSIALGSGSLNNNDNSMTIGSSTQGMDFNVTGNVTLLSNADNSYGHLNVLQGTASLVRVSASHAVLHPFSGSAAGPGSFLALDANNRVVITTGDGTGSAGGTPGGSNTQVQFNDAGAFQGDSGLVYNKTTDTLTAVRVTASNGIDPQGPGTDSTQVGNALAAGITSIAIGEGARTLGTQEIAIGHAAIQSSAGGSNTLIGSRVHATGSNGATAVIALGAGATIDSNPGTTNFAMALGANATASYSSAITIGYRAKAAAVNAIALGSGSLNTTTNSMTIGSPSQGMDFNVTGNVTLLNNGDNSYGHLNVCQGTASILHLSGCSPITVHSPMQMQQGLSLSFNGASNTAKITNNGSNLDINSPGSIVLNSGNSTITSSANISASAFYVNGVELTPGVTTNPGGSDTQVQFNQNGSFAGNGGLKYNGSGSLTLSGSDSGFQASEFVLGDSSNKIGRLTVDEDAGYVLTVGSDIGGIDLSGSDGITAIVAKDTNFTVASQFTNTALVLSNMDGDAVINLGHDGVISASSNLAVQGSSALQGNVTTNGSLNVEGNTTLGNASGDSITIKAGSITQTDNALTYRLKDGENGLSGPGGGNGALMFFTGSGGDFMKFHTSGSAKGVVFDQQTYLAKGGGLSGSKAGAGSYLALDADNKIVLASAGGGSTSPAGANTNVQFNQNGSFGGNSNLKFDGSGSLTLSGSSAGFQASEFLLGDKDNKIGRFTIDEDSGYVMTIASEGGGIDLTGSEGVTVLVANGTNFTVASQFTDTALNVTNMEGVKAASMAHDGKISGSNHLNIGGNGNFRGNLNTEGSLRAGANFTPKITLDVHYTGSLNPINLSNNTGGGQVVFFGTGSADLATGGVYYLNGDGGWAAVNSANTGSGHNQMLAISIGTKPLIHGMLLKGFFDVNTNFSGSFRKGGPVYVQSSSAGVRALGEGGYLSSSAPTAADSYVRAVGYATATPNVIYFNPDATYVEIG